MYKIVSKVNRNEVWAAGFHLKKDAAKHIPEIRKYMYQADKSKKLIVIKNV